MNSSTMIKIMAGLLPTAPITTDMIETSINQDQLEEAGTGEDNQNEEYADYSGPTMEEEIAAHSGSVPDIKGTEGYNVQVGDDFDPLAGVYAVDSNDGDITDNIEVTSNNVDTSSPGNYTVSYRVENSNSNWYEYTRTITVSESASDSVPMVPPTEAQLSDEDSSESEASDSEDITFLGTDDTTIEQGDEFEPKEDVQVIDVDGSDISHRIYIQGEVDTETPGEYNIAYAVFDRFGDSHATARTITVE